MTSEHAAGWGVNVTERLPQRVSPSRLADFKQCPAKFYFGSIMRLPRMATDATTVGTLAHEAFEKVFELPRDERTPDAAAAFVAPAWDGLCADRHYDEVRDHRDDLIARAETMVRSWFGVENPTGFDPVGTEMRLVAEAAGVSMLGILDRVDIVDGRVYISDYKTGKVPAPNDRFLDEKFFGMKVYALLYHLATGVTPYKLRLIYVAGGQRSSVRHLMVDDALLDTTRRQVTDLWRSIKRCASTGWWPARTQTLCQWCDYTEICPAWGGAEYTDETAVRAAFGAETQDA